VKIKNGMIGFIMFDWMDILDKFEDQKKEKDTGGRAE